MWLCTRIGFFSLVKKGAPGQWQIRARREKDLENLLAQTGIKANIIKTPEADYCTRIIATGEQLTQVFQCLAATITYPNFKDEVADNADQRDKLGAYHEMWGAMADYQTGNNAEARMKRH